MEKMMRTLEKLEAETRNFVEGLVPKADTATLVTLSGELGAGKTAFAKAVAKVLGVDEPVTSPTFVLEKIYTLAGKKWERLVHIDAYRLESGVDLVPLGFDELMKDPGNLILLEWPEKVADALPSPATHILLATTAEGAHTIAYG